MPTTPEALFATQNRQLGRSPKIRQPVYAAIKEAIFSGQIAPNQPLIEEQLANSLGVSRTPVREALAILQHERIIAPGGGRGLFVHKLTQAEFVELFSATEVIKPYLARRAARLISEQHLTRLESSIQLAKAATARNDKASFLSAWRDFLRCMGEAAGNNLLAEFVTRNEERTDLFLMHTSKAISIVNMTLSVRELQSIYQALANHDPEAAERTMIYHTQSLRERWAEWFVSQTGEGA